MRRLLTAALAVLLLSVVASANVVTLTFEGLADGATIGNWYNGGGGGNLGIQFSDNSLALIAIPAGNGNFGGEPSCCTIAFFLSGGADTMNVPAGFDTGFSFFYSAVNSPGVVNVWSGVDATGNLLASISLPVTPDACGGYPQDFCPFFPIGVSFSGTAMSVDFGGTANQIGFDNITLGSDIPGVPEPASMVLLGTGLLGIARKIRRKA
ncbi:MAG: PEP-CTERM sorting domain-containing protein [Acidobacteriia bacterium]|nr:PEP-CTERM sorting domain-containing protein [Terriglobia bacterium]